MSNCYLLLVALFLLLPGSLTLSATDSGPNSQSDQEKKRLAVKQLNMMPLAFTQNNGQWDDQALFSTSQGGASMWFTKDKVYYQFTRDTSAPQSPIERSKFDLAPVDPGEVSHSLELIVLTASFVGANPNPEVVGENLLEFVTSYPFYSDQCKDCSNIPSYQSIVYKQIYPGLDLKYYGNGNGQMEYDFIVSPGADPSQIAVRYDGAKNICVNEVGELVVETKWGRVIERKPLVYQIVSGELQEIKAEYYLLDDFTFGFRLLEDFSPDYALVIDPALGYSSYLGEGDTDVVTGIVLDGESAWITGYSNSYYFPNVFGCNGAAMAQHYTAFLIKLNCTGNTLTSLTCISSGDCGGSSAHGDTFGTDLALDASGKVYLCGYTTMCLSYPGYPFVETFQATNLGGNDAFVLKFASNGVTLLYGSMLGGTGDDRAYGIEVDASGNFYVSGQTSSTDFPMLNAYQGTYQGGAFDAFVTKFFRDGTVLLYSTYLGGSGSDACANRMAVDATGKVFVAGITDSPNFPTVGAFQSSYQGGVHDGFVTKFATAGTSLIYSTYLGGSDDDVISGIAIDLTGNVYLTGSTYSLDFPLVTPYQSVYHGLAEAFVTKLNSAGSGLVFSTYLGGSSDDGGVGIEVDGGDNVIVTGGTNSSNFPTLLANQSFYQGGTQDGFVTKFNSSGTGVIFSTYFGGNLYDYGLCAAFDLNGNAYIGGYTGSANFPTANGYDMTFSAGWDGFISKFGIYVCADADNNGIVTISDAVYLINYIFSGGPAPNPLLSADADCNEIITVSDAVYIINYIFSGGPAPCSACC